MKKIVLALGCVAMFGLASCDKEKTCSCVTTQNGSEVMTNEVTIPEGDCEDSNSTQEVMGVEQVTECEEV